MIKTTNSIRMELSTKTMEYLQKGFTIAGAYECEGIPMMTFVKGDEEIVQSVVAKIAEVKTYGYVSAFELVENGEVVATYYEIARNVYSDNLSETERIYELRLNRSTKKRVPRHRELNVKAMMKAIRAIPGFKTVAIKNLRILRDTETLAYTIENVTTRNKAVLSKHILSKL